MKTNSMIESAQTGMTKCNPLFLALLGLLAFGAGPMQAQTASPIQAEAVSVKVAGSVSLEANLASTNSAFSVIQAELTALTNKLQGALKTMASATASSPSAKADNVRQFADFLKQVAVAQLGDESSILKSANALVARFEDNIAKGNKASKDLNLSPSARAIYAQVVPGLEQEYSKLLDARNAVAAIRRDFIKTADMLRSASDAMGYAVDSGDLLVASQAFRSVLSDVVEFTGKISAMINNLGSKAISPVS